MPFHSDLIEENDTHWVNEEFDALIDQAFLLTDPAERAAVYAEADNILVNTDAAIAPIYYYVTNDLTASNVIRTYSNITTEYYEKSMSPRTKPVRYFARMVEGQGLLCPSAYKRAESGYRSMTADHVLHSH